VGDAFWLDDSAWKDFYKYEMELNQSMAGRQISVLCAYPLAVTRAADIFDVARAHQCAVAKRNRNWEVAETPALKQAKEEITVWEWRCRCWCVDGGQLRGPLDDPLLELFIQSCARGFGQDTPDGNWRSGDRQRRPPQASEAQALRTRRLGVQAR